MRKDNIVTLSRRTLKISLYEETSYQHEILALKLLKTLMFRLLGCVRCLFGVGSRIDHCEEEIEAGARSVGRAHAAGGGRE